MITQTSHFANGRLEILNVTGAGSEGSGLTEFIEKYEPEWLRNVLGLEFAEAFKQGLAAEPIADKWKNLRDGCNYRDNDGKLRRWCGLKEHDSPLAMFIWCEYTMKNTSVSTVAGEKIDGKTKAARADYNRKYSKIWNAMVDLTGYYDRKKNLQYGDLYNFLTMAKENGALIYTDFDVDVIKPYYFKNTFGI